MNTYPDQGPIARAVAIRYLTTNETFLASEAFKSLMMSMIQFVDWFTNWCESRSRRSSMHAAYRAKTRRRNRRRK